MLAAAGEEGVLPPAEALSGRLHQAVEEARFGTNPRGDGSLQPADFDSQETALEIKMETPDSLYLKGFTGSRYKDGHWEPLSCSGYYQQNALFYWLHREGFSGLSQMEQVGQLLGKKGEHGSISVKNSGACRKYVYAPYELAGETEPGAKSWSDSFLTAEGPSGAGEYQLETLPNMVKEWPSLAAELFTKKTGKELSRYRTNESHYNVRMYEDYSEVTDAQRKLLAENIGREGNQDKGHVDYKQAISAVQTWLEENFIYTERIRESEDPVEECFRSKKGCDVHYASAAVLMFRYYGIPARYAEGYLITPEDIEGKKPGDLISIPRANNHAWPEIYIDSFGWVPLEVTPEYYDRMEQPDLSKGLENQGASDAQKDYDRQNTRQYVYTDPESRPEDESILWKAILLLAALDLLVLALAYGIAKLIQKLAYLRKRKKAFGDADPRKAVCAVYTYMRALKVPFTQAAREIGNRAAYSKCEISEADRSRMLEEWERMKKQRHEKKRNRAAAGTAADADRRELRRRRNRGSKAGAKGHTG